HMKYLGSIAPVFCLVGIGFEWLLSMSYRGQATVSRKMDSSTSSRDDTVTTNDTPRSRAARYLKK
ncbi:MAG: hypothetical protein O7C58_06985, partial [Rickettsia endosymbiont of Ixodes persulcatus]|nr:hypothetical protein [Rickettsia endosymbiont of Ixodes persulcatus]